MRIGIIGNGFVGKATFIFKCKDIEILVYDINPKLCMPLNLSLEELCNSCEILFISVPTPMSSSGKCHLDILSGVIDKIKSYCDLDKKIVISRCTVPPGTCDKFNCFFMPEFLTEKNFQQDFINNKDWIFGIKNKEIQDTNFKNKMNTLINLAYENKCIKYNNVSFVSNKEAEMIKLFRNCFLATKVSFCNEMYKYCQHQDIDYENVRILATKDTRIGESHSKVPGPDGKFGYGGTCFPKDMNNLNYEMIQSGLHPYLINASLKRNSKEDRPDKDWENNEGRTIVK